VSKPTLLVEATPGSAHDLRAAGGRELVRDLRVWRVPEAALPGLRSRGDVLRAQPNRILRSESTGASDPLAGREWWRGVVGADAATPPGPGKPITIVDSGLDITHEEFSSRPNTTLMNEQTTTSAEDDHGTEVASVIAAPVNGLGLVGIYPQAALRSWDASPFGALSVVDAVHGIVAAADAGPPGVINISFGGNFSSPILESAVLYAVRHGSLVVASSGNDGQVHNPLSYPAAYPHVLTVGASDRSGRAADFSSRSAFVDLVAPGTGMLVAEPALDDPSGYLLDVAGTSFSAPLVSGAAAWVWTLRPTLTNTQLFDVMRFSAHDIPPAGHDSATGWGMLNVSSAIAAAAPPVDPVEPNDTIDEVAPGRMFSAGDAPITTSAHRTVSLSAGVDRAEDPDDVYRVFVPPGGSATASTTAGGVDLRLFAAKARTLEGRPAAVSAHAGVAQERATIRNTTKRAVWAYVEVAPGKGVQRTRYTLHIRTAVARR
jgi:hypothetical protein